MGAHLLDVRVLGPVEVHSGSTVIRIDRPLERALLARLALANGTPVPDDRLAADLWGDGPLARPSQRLRVLASRLRTAVHTGDAELPPRPQPQLRRISGGYALEAQATDLIEARAAADALAAAVRRNDPAEVSRLARQALAPWRGPALADLRDIPFAATEGARLDSWHLDLLVERFTADLAQGGAAAAIGELEALTTEHPVHEPLWCLLSVALYRTGRQSDALGRLTRLRQHLAESLGVDPAPATTETEVRLLRQDPTLLLTSTTTTTAQPATATASATGSASPNDTSAIGAVGVNTAAKPVVGPLPDRGTSFVGRDNDLPALAELLHNPGLVTLTGGPGAGKSRLALEAAHSINAIGRPVRLVELAPLRRCGSVLEAIAGDEAGTSDAITKTAIAVEGSLLILDNAEHLVDEVAEVVSGLLRRTDHLTILVTSQRPLLITPEHVHHVAPLTPAAAAHLFNERCSTNARGSDTSHVDTICAAVDYLPLGVELAAGLTRTLTVEQLAHRIQDRLRLLVDSAHDEYARHTSLVAALDWSHQLLSEQEQAVLRRVSVFSGGFTLEAAERVVPDELVDAGLIAPTLIELADRSLITVDAGDGRRFNLLETVKDYARAKLTTAPDRPTPIPDAPASTSAPVSVSDRGREEDQIRAAHLDWCIEHVLSCAGDDDFASAEQVAAVFAEWPNLLQALETAPGTSRAATALSLALELHTPWLIRGWHQESVRQFAALVDADGVEPAVRLEALSSHAFIYTMLGRFDEAATQLSRAETLARDLDDDRLTTTVLYHRGIVEIERGNLDEALIPLLEGERLAHKTESERRISAFNDAIGTQQLYSGHTEQALTRFVTAEAADRAYGDEHSLARGLNNEAQTLLSLGRYREALEKAEESDYFAQRLDDREILPMNATVRGNVAAATGDLEAAERHHRSAVAISESDGAGATLAHIDLADTLILRGFHTEAADLLRLVDKEAQPMSIRWLAARAIEAALAEAVGDNDLAATLTAAARKAFAASTFAWPRYVNRLPNL